MFGLRRRTVGLLVLVTVLLAALVSRIFELTVLQNARLSAMAISERTREIILPTRRGRILDAEGHLLAGNLTLDQVSVTPDMLTPGDTNELARALREPAASLRARMKLGTPLYALVATALSPTQGAAIQAMNLPGVVVTPTDSRTYPNGSLLGPVLGFVGSADQGLAGVEYEYNRLLTGTPGREIVQVDAGGNPLPSFPETVTPAKNGDTIELTLDRTISEFAQEILDAGIRKTHAQSGRILVMDPKTGAILAMVQFPSGNPNDPFTGPPGEWVDQAIQDANPPGSTFKPVTATAALMTGVANETKKWYDPGYIIIDGVELHGWEWPGSFGWLNLNQAFMHSSDIAFMKMGLELGVKRLYSFMRKFNLFTPPPVDLPGATAGFALPEKVVNPIDLATIAFGQTNEISALQLGDAVSAVANGGYLMRPHVLKEVLSPTGRVLSVVRPQVIRRIMPTWVSQDIIHGMEQVISPKGTGAYAMVPGYRLAGKTGTAQLLHNGHISNRVFMSSFLGYGPNPNPQVLILVQLSKPKGAFYGGQIAAPLFAQLMGATLRYLGIAPTLPLPKTGVVRVPDVVGLPGVQAQADLAAHHLFVLTLGKGPFATAVEPGAGTTVVRGGSVLVVLGPAQASKPSVHGNVPDLLGLPVRKAILLLGQRGLALRPVGTGVAVSQSPEPGTELKTGGVVTVHFLLPPGPHTSGSGHPVQSTTSSNSSGTIPGGP